MPWYIDGSALLKKYNSRNMTANEMYEALIEQPTADVEKVVRCKNCKYFIDKHCYHSDNRVAYRVPNFGKHYVFLEGIKVKPDHFCSYGKRKSSKGECEK